MTEARKTTSDQQQEELNGELLQSCGGFMASLKKAKAMCEKGADINCRDSFDQTTPLSLAIGRKDPELVAGILALGANPNGRDHKDNPVLIQAVYTKKTGSVAHLLDRGAHINISGTEGQTALLAAIENADCDMAGLLVQAGASPYIPDNMNRIPLIAAAETEAVDLARLVLLAYKDGVPSAHLRDAIKVARSPDMKAMLANELGKVILKDGLQSKTEKRTKRLVIKNGGRQ